MLSLLFISRKRTTFADEINEAAGEVTPDCFKIRRDGRVVDRGGLENR